MTIQRLIPTLVGTLFLLPALSAAQSTAQKPVKIEAELVEIVATVTQLDNSSRSVTLTGPKGNSITLEAGDEVRNFDQLAVGDKVDVEYFESLAIFVTKADGESPHMNSQVDVELAALGGKPGMTEVAAMEVKATIVALDRKNRIVTLKGPDAGTMTHKVLDETIDLDQVDVGDQVVVQATQSVAISVEPQ